MIGAGVSGLTTALVLARRGWRVDVIADRFGGDTVSTVAGALWEWPPSVCGRHHDQIVLARSTGWAMRSYLRFAHLAADPHTGVSMRPAVFYFMTRIEDDPAELAKMVEVEGSVPGFVRDPGLIDTHGVNRDSGVVDAYSYMAPIIDTGWYLAWLGGEAEAAGVTITQRRVHGSLVEQEERLRADYGAELVVNCAGLDGGALADDLTMDAHRGALVRVVNDGAITPRVTAAHAVANNASTEDQNMVFIVPRGVDRLLLGGLVQPGEHGTDLTLDRDRAVRDMIDRCFEFMPALRGAQLDPVDPLRVGLRPFRSAGVRLEAEPGTRIVHNYGHGGAGVTLSWGCAYEVADLASIMLAGRVDGHGGDLGFHTPLHSLIGRYRMSGSSAS